ncbi:hypothetical protein KCU79_g81, partial [Aureobasidium melanogenum]
MLDSILELDTEDTTANQSLPSADWYFDSVFLQADKCSPISCDNTIGLDNEVTRTKSCLSNCWHGKRMRKARLEFPRRSFVRIFALPNGNHESSRHQATSLSSFHCINILLLLPCSTLLPLCRVAYTTSRTPSSFLLCESVSHRQYCATTFTINFHYHIELMTFIHGLYRHQRRQSLYRSSRSDGQSSFVAFTPRSKFPFRLQVLHIAHLYYPMPARLLLLLSTSSQPLLSSTFDTYSCRTDL